MGWMMMRVRGAKPAGIMATLALRTTHDARARTWMQQRQVRFVAYQTAHPDPKAQIGSIKAATATIALQPMPLVFAIRPETFGSGFQTAGTKSRPAPRTMARATSAVIVPGASCAAARGTTTRQTCAPPPVTETILSTATSLMASVSPELFGILLQ